MATNVVGLDVGGANLKYAFGGGMAKSTALAMWRRCDDLADVIADDLDRIAAGGRRIDALAATMTGELADCFADRAVGVNHIVNHVCRAASRLGIDQVGFYGVDGRFHDAVDAAVDVDLVAAANWHALASFVARDIANDATLIDVGSTTTDIIPISNGRVATAATTDFDRLSEGSLVYVGCRRTPVCALVDQLTFRGRVIPVMNELFATIDDARLLTAAAPQDAEDCDTADGAPRTRTCAANRLARMIGLDRRSVSVGDAEQLALQIVDSAKQRIGRCLESIPLDPLVVISGHGQDLIELPGRTSILQLSEKLGPAMSRCAPALAVASLYSSEPGLLEDARCDA